jgi:hypothetical protein
MTMKQVYFAPSDSLKMFAGAVTLYFILNICSSEPTIPGMQLSQ